MVIFSWSRPRARRVGFFFFVARSRRPLHFSPLSQGCRLARGGCGVRDLISPTPWHVPLTVWPGRDSPGHYRFAGPTQLVRRLWIVPGFKPHQTLFLPHVLGSTLLLALNPGLYLEKDSTAGSYFFFFLYFILLSPSFFCRSSGFFILYQLGGRLSGFTGKALSF